MIKKLKQLGFAWKFLIGILFVYLILFLINQENFIQSLTFFYEIILKIIPVFILIFILMALTNYFITPAIITKHLKKSLIKKWFLVIVGGILSTGPIYMWYPLLADLKQKGLSYGLISAFLYNRAIKIPLIPLMIIYFSWKYILVVGILMVFMSIIQGIFIDKIMKGGNEK